MGALSDDDASNLLDAKFRGASLDVPSSYWVALSLTEPSDDGTNVTEPSGGTAAGYARAEAPADSATWAAPVGRSIATAIDIAFPDPAPGDDWGDIGWYALYDDPTGGAFRGWGFWRGAISVDENQTGPVAPAGSIIIYAPGSSS